MQYLKITSSPWDLLSKQKNVYFLKNSNLQKVDCFNINRSIWKKHII